MSVNQSDPTSYGFSQPLITQLGRPILAQRDPTDRDKAQFGTVWINQAANNVFMITTIIDNVAHWELLAASSGAMTSLRSDDGTLATPSGGVIGIFGGANIITSTATNAIDVAVTPDVNLTGGLSVGSNISLPDTDSSALAGVIQFGSERFISDFGTGNTFIGKQSGNTTLTPGSATNNTGIGFDVLTNLTTSPNNVALGCAALTALQGGNGDNIAIGHENLVNLTTGNNVISIGGDGTGGSYTTESNNIVISNAGTVADANALRIGTTGSGTGQTNKTFIAGIYNTSIGGVSGVVQIDSTGKLGSSNGTDGQILIAETGNKPVWANLTSTGATVAITYDFPNVNLEATGTAGLTNLAGDTGVASPIAGVISVVGDGGITTETSASGAILTVRVSEGLDGQLLIGKTGDTPIWANLSSSGGSIAITNGDNSINLEATGTAGLTELTSQSGTALPVAGNINVFGTSPINTSASGSTLAVNLTNGANGQVLIGGGAGPVWNNIVAGDGISIVNTANGIMISGTGGGKPAFKYGLSTPISRSTSSPVGSPTGPNFLFFPTVSSGGTVMTQLFDIGGNVNVGDGVTTPLTFTALVDGLYQLQWDLAFSITSTDNTPRLYQQIITTASTYQTTQFANKTGTNTYTIASQFMMVAGNTATFKSYITTATGNPKPYTALMSAGDNFISGYMV